MIVVCARDRPRSAIISTSSRRLSLNRRYQRTHRMMTSRSKWRPTNPVNRAPHPVKVSLQEGFEFIEAEFGNLSVILCARYNRREGAYYAEQIEEGNA